MRAALILGLLGGAVFVLAHPPMWGHGGEAAFPGWDATRVFWADLAFARQAVTAGELPLWNPYDRVGYPFMAEPQSGMFDPVTWLLVLLAVTIGSAPAWLIVLKSVLHFAIGASGVAAFLRQRRLPTWAVSLGALAFVLCPRLDKLKDQSALWPTAWIGWLFFAVDRCLRAPSPRRGAWLGAAAGMTVVSGYPPSAFRLSLLAIPYAVALVVQEARDPENRRAYLRRLSVAGAIAGLVLVLLCAGQVLATAQVLPETKRATIDMAHILASRTRLEHAIGSIAPFSETTPLLMYGGFACALGVLASLWRSRSEDFVLVFFGAFGFLLACGENAPVLPALARLPVFSSFRIAGHYLTLPVVVLVIVGPIGLARLADRSRLMPRWPPLVTVLATVLGFFVFAPRPDAWQAGVVSVTAALVLTLAFAEPVWRRRAGWALVPVLGLDLFVAGRPVAEILQPLPDPTRAEQMAEAVDRSEVFRVADFGWAKNRMGPREGVRDLVGHRPALTDGRYMMLYAQAPRWVSLLQGANVSVVGFGNRVSTPKGARLRRVDGRRGLYRVPDPWPLAFWTRDVALVTSAEFALSWLQARREPGAAIEERTIAEDTAQRLRDLAEVGADPVAPVLLEQSLHRLVFEVEAPADGLFVVLEGHAPGWRATVDGEPTAVHRANLIFRAVELPAGRHRVVFTYAPPGVRALWWTWLMTICGLLVLGLDHLRPRRRPREPGKERKAA